MSPERKTRLGRGGARLVSRAPRPRKRVAPGRGAGLVPRGPPSPHPHRLGDQIQMQTHSLTTLLGLDWR